MNLDTCAQPAPSRVLLVEDEVLIRVALADELREVGFSVVEASDADEAISFLSAGMAVDAIFTDVRMPGSMDGLQFAGWVRARFPTLPIILTSGNIGPGGTGGVGLFLPKPYDFKAVVRLISEQLARGGRDRGE